MARYGSLSVYQLDQQKASFVKSPYCLSPAPSLFLIHSSFHIERFI